MAPPSSETTTTTSTADNTDTDDLKKKGIDDDSVYCLVVGDLLEQLECPICNEVYKIPVFVCENGHSICETCKIRMKRCGYCQGTYLSIRNRCLENILSNCSVPCRLQDRGCSDIILLANFTDHVTKCLYNPDRVPTPVEGEPASKPSRRKNSPTSRTLPRPAAPNIDTMFEELTNYYELHARQRTDRMPAASAAAMDFFQAAAFPQLQIPTTYGGRRAGNISHGPTAYPRHAPIFSQASSSTMGHSTMANQAFYHNPVEGVRFGGLEMDLPQTVRDPFEPRGTSVRVGRNLNDPLAHESGQNRSSFAAWAAPVLQDPVRTSASSHPVNVIRTAVESRQNSRRQYRHPTTFTPIANNYPMSATFMQGMIPSSRSSPINVLASRQVSNQPPTSMPVTIQSSNYLVFPTSTTMTDSTYPNTTHINTTTSNSSTTQFQHLNGPAQFRPSTSSAMAGSLRIPTPIPDNHVLWPSSSSTDATRPLYFPGLTNPSLNANNAFLQPLDPFFASNVQMYPQHNQQQQQASSNNNSTESTSGTNTSSNGHSSSRYNLLNFYGIPNNNMLSNTATTSGSSLSSATFGIMNSSPAFPVASTSTSGESRRRRKNASTSNVAGPSSSMSTSKNTNNQPVPSEFDVYGASTSSSSSAIIKSTGRGPTSESFDVTMETFADHGSTMDLTTTGTKTGVPIVPLIDLAQESSDESTPWTTPASSSSRARNEQAEHDYSESQLEVYNHCSSCNFDNLSSNQNCTICKMPLKSTS